MEFILISLIGMYTPKFIKDIPNKTIESWGEYCVNHIVALIIIAFLIIILPIIAFLLGRKTEVKFEFSFLFFKITGRDKKVKKAKENNGEMDDVERYKKQIKDLEIKQHNYGIIIDDIEHRNRELSKHNKVLKKSLDEKVQEISIKNEQNENNDKIIFQVRENYSKIEEIVNKFKNTAYYLNEVDNNLNKILTAKGPIRKGQVLSEIAQEIFYNLNNDLPTEGKDIRISLMKYILEQDSLKIIAKFGNFNCNTGDIVLKRGQGLAGKSLELKRIINIGNVKSEESFLESAITIGEYIPSIRHDTTISSLHIPIWSLDNVVAVLNLTSSSVDAFSEEDVIIARLYSLKIAIALMLEGLKKR